MGLFNFIGYFVVCPLLLISFFMNYNYICIGCIIYMLIVLIVEYISDYDNE
jgi:hypothetical protein